MSFMPTVYQAAAGSPDSRYPLDFPKQQRRPPVEVTHGAEIERSTELQRQAVDLLNY